MDKKEKELWNKLIEGDKGALRIFYENNKPGLLRWVLSRVKNKKDAEEIVHDAFLGFLDSLPLFRGKSGLLTFLTSIAKHEVADYWRKKYAKKAILTVPFVDQVYTEKLYSSKQTAQVIKRVYRQLLPEQTKILKMKYEEGLSVREIAKELKVSVKAAESKLFRARKAFQLVYNLSTIDE